MVLEPNNTILTRAVHNMQKRRLIGVSSIYQRLNQVRAHLDAGGHYAVTNQGEVIFDLVPSCSELFLEGFESGWNKAVAQMNTERRLKDSDPTESS